MGLPEYLYDGCWIDLKHLLMTLRHFPDATPTKEFLRVYYTSTLHKLPLPQVAPNVEADCAWILEMATPLANLATPAQLAAMIELVKA